MDSTIPKKTIDVIFEISTDSDTHVGAVYLEPGERLSDLMNNGKPFVPIKSSGISEFHFVNKDFIISIREKING